MSHQRGGEGAGTTTAAANGHIPRKQGDQHECQGLTSAVLGPVEATSASAKSGRACTNIEKSGTLERGGHVGREGSASQLEHAMMRRAILEGYDDRQCLSR